MAAEIERVYLLRALPTPLPRGEVWRIDQGYLPVRSTVNSGDSHVPGVSVAPHQLEGRLRRITHSDGSVEHIHTMKSGIPLVLAECELPSTDAPLDIPDWLAPFIVREVTEEPAFRNAELALRAGLLTGQ